jgi:hypothetical protein
MRQEAFQNPESIFPRVGKLFRIPKVIFPASRNFSESRKLPGARKNTFGIPEILPGACREAFGIPESLQEREMRKYGGTKSRGVNLLHLRAFVLIQTRQSGKKDWEFRPALHSAKLKSPIKTFTTNI